QHKAAEKVEKAPHKDKKDYNSHMRARSAYMFFVQDWHERIKAENPDLGFGEVGKLLGAKWKKLDDEEKKPYVEQAAKDKMRAENEKAAYEVRCPSTLTNPLTPRRAAKRTTSPAILSQAVNPGRSLRPTRVLSNYLIGVVEFGSGGARSLAKK
ncbi:high mobility group box domain-containing protein, partial [Mycena vulgaris]